MRNEPHCSVGAIAITSTHSETIGNTPLLRLMRVTQGIVDERDHPLDDYTIEMPDRYQGEWEVIR